MTRSFGPLRRITALSVTITLLTAPIAAAQSPEAAPARVALNDTALLSPTAFARLLQRPRTEVTQALVVKHPSHIELRRLVTTPAAGRLPAANTLASAPQQRSWVARHKVATGILIGVGVFVAALFIRSCSGGHGCD